MKRNFFKVGAAAALTVTGVSAITSMKTVRAANFTAIKQVKISYLPGKSLNIWTNYENGQFMGYRAKDGTVWNVADTALDKKGNLWYKVGTREWIEARYTVDVTAGEKAEVSQAPTVKKTEAKQTKTTVNKKTAAVATKTATQKEAEKIAKVKKAKQIVNTTIKKTSQNTNKTSSTQATSKAASIVALAKQQIGKNYVWGAEGPDSFDCSGLVQYVYQKAAGVNLPRTTYDQVKVGQTVSLNNLQPGDLVFWGSTTAPYHVAIYVGNNQYVNAATPEQGTILQTVSSYFTPSIAKRVL